MIAIYIITGFLLFIICFLFIPIRFVVNTDTNIYAISQPIFFGLRAIPDKKTLIKLRIRILFIWFTINPLEQSKKPIQQRNKKRNNKNKTSMQPGKFIELISNFRLKRLRANIDTGNFPLNAQLIPIVQQINGKKTSININFQDYNSVDLLISTQLYKMASTLIRNRNK